MSGEVASNVHPKTPRPKHRHSKSAVAVPTEGGQQPNQSQQRTGRRAHERKQGQTTPAWQDTAATPEVTGDFDSDGNFVSAPTTNGLQTLENDSPTEKGHAQKGRRKQRPKEVNQNVATQSRSDGGSIPTKEAHHQVQAVPSQASNHVQTPAKSTAYAGSGWHASPAASALPMPKFFSKSVPANTSQTSLQARLEQEKENSDKSESPPQEEATPAKLPPAQATAAALPRPSESPLDFFFKADRQEKAGLFIPLLEIMFRTDHNQKAKGASAISINTPLSKPPPKIPQSEPAPANHWARIYGVDQKRHVRHSSNGSGKELFMMELDGNSAPSVRLTPPITSQVGLHKSVIVPTNLHHQQSDPMPSLQAVNQSIYGSPNYGKSMPSLPSPISNAPQTGSPFNRPQSSQAPRSAGSTPAPRNNNPYHYGNKNLSPLFQAARHDNVRRSSSLRQEMRPAELPGNQPPQQLPGSPSQAGGTADASSVARDYLQAHLGQEVRMPDIDLSQLDGSKGRHTMSYVTHNPVSGVSSPSVGYGPSGRGQPADVKSMEDDLRRLLNLNILGGHGTQ